MLNNLTKEDFFYTYYFFLLSFSQIHSQGFYCNNLSGLSFLLGPTWEAKCLWEHVNDSQ